MNQLSSPLYSTECGSWSTGWRRRRRRHRRLLPAAAAGQRRSGFPGPPAPQLQARGRRFLVLHQQRTQQPRHQPLRLSAPLPSPSLRARARPRGQSMPPPGACVRRARRAIGSPRRSTSDDRCCRRPRRLSSACPLPLRGAPRRRDATQRTALTFLDVKRQWDRFIIYE